MTRIVYIGLERLGQCPAGFAPSEFFMDYIRSFLPPIYMDVAQSLSQKQQLDFVQVWAWESSNLLAECGLREELGQVVQYFGRLHEPRPVGTSVRISEVYRSAFLRTLAWFRQLGKLEETDFWEETARACPVDLSLWQIQCVTPPFWWPRFNKPMGTSPPNMQVITLGDWEVLRQLHKTELDRIEGREFEILAAEGPCLWLDDPAGTSLHFSLIGFAYRKSGSSMPDAKLVRKCLDQRATWLLYPQGESLLAALDPENIKNFIPGELGWRLTDLEVVSLAARFGPLSSNVWQWYRGYHAMWLPSAFFCDGDWKFGCDDVGWFLSRNDLKLVMCQDWRLGALEELDENSYAPHGQFLIVDSAELNQRLKEGELRLAHLLAVQVKTQKHSYEKAEEFEHVELLDVSSIIT